MEENRNTGQLNAKEFSKISRRAQILLNSQEGYQLDYKRNIDGVRSRDLVAFANSKTGGTILVGVDEYNKTNGMQRGKVVGCPVGDNEKLKIISKAQSCIPQIDVDIIIENTDEVPFYRIEVPSGEYKPYCTAKGLYMIRGDGRNNPITPNNLLNIFLEEQGKEFIERFGYATKKIDNKLSSTKLQVDELNMKVNDIKNRITKDMNVLIRNLKELSAEVEKELK